MMTIHKYLDYVHTLLSHTKKESLEMSLADVHAKGLFSLVISGTTPGKLLRSFIASRKIKPFEAQLHTHRYGIRLTVLRGQVMHHTAIKAQHFSNSGVNMSEFTYKSVLNGGNGLTAHEQDAHLLINSYVLPVGSSIVLKATDIHTVSCSKGAIWLVEELGFDTETSKVYGIPFIVDGLYNKPSMFQTVDRHQTVLSVVGKLLYDYVIPNDQ